MRTRAREHGRMPGTLDRLRPLALALVLAACKSDDTGGNEEAGSSSSESGISSIGSESVGSSADTTGTVTDTSDTVGETLDTSTATDTSGGGTSLPCGDKTWACGDGLDNDDDGKIDLDDPECISPCDDTEGTFSTDLPGQNMDCKGDCYWDQDSGVGNDHCEWNLICDPENPGAGTNCEYDPNYGMCDLEQMQACVDLCSPITPNGCDCFGCCEIQGEFYYLGNGDACSLDNLAGCQSCTYHEGCNNPCVPEECELCFGQTIEDLPEDCTEAACPAGTDNCESSDDCEVGWYCQTGCCYPIELP
jgi:hypothetical protein